MGDVARGVLAGDVEVDIGMRRMAVGGLIVSLVSGCSNSGDWNPPSLTPQPSPGSPTPVDLGAAGRHTLPIRDRAGSGIGRRARGRGYRDQQRRHEGWSSCQYAKPTAPIGDFDITVTVATGEEAVTDPVAFLTEFLAGAPPYEQIRDLGDAAAYTTRLGRDRVFVLVTNPNGNSLLSVSTKKQRPGGKADVIRIAGFAVRRL